VKAAYGLRSTLPLVVATLSDSTGTGIELRVRLRDTERRETEARPSDDLHQQQGISPGNESRFQAQRDRIRPSVAHCKPESVFTAI
jgi:hypothetical protein